MKRPCVPSFSFYENSKTRNLIRDLRGKMMTISRECCKRYSTKLAVHWKHTCLPGDTTTWEYTKRKVSYANLGAKLINSHGADVSDGMTRQSHVQNRFNLKSKPRYSPVQKFNSTRKFKYTAARRMRPGNRSNRYFIKFLSIRNRLESCRNFLVSIYIHLRMNYSRIDRVTWEIKDKLLQIHRAF